MWLGLAGSAALAFALDGGSALAGHRVHPADVAGRRPARSARNLSSSVSSRTGCSRWPGPISWERSLTATTTGARSAHDSGSTAQAWVPSLYLGGLTFVLALSSLTFRHGPPWRVWFTVIVVVSLLGSLGPYTSPIWMARVPLSPSSPTVQRSGFPISAPSTRSDTTPIRADGYLRDGDGGFYWWLTTVLPGFRQFRFPAKLFTFTTLGMAVLAGLGWDRVAAGRAARCRGHFCRAPGPDPGRARGGGLRAGSDPRVVSDREHQVVVGPLERQGGYQVILRSLGQAAIVFGLGLLLTMRGPQASPFRRLGRPDRDDGGPGGGQRALRPDGSPGRCLKPSPKS